MDSTTQPPAATTDDIVIVVPSGLLSGFLGWFVRSRPILKARLEYAARGWFTFPAPFDGQKKSLKWKTKKNPVNWGATTDPKVIREEFRSQRYRDQNIGLMTGIQNNIIVIETDTVAGHGPGLDGATKLREWEAEKAVLPETLMQESPSGSVHRFFEHPGEGIKVKMFNDIFGPGSRVDCKGDGGMVIVAPSTRPDKPGKLGGTYRWINPGTPIAKLPLDHPLFDVIIEKPKETRSAVILPFKPRTATVSDEAVSDNDNPFSQYTVPRSDSTPRDGVTHWETVNQTALANLSAWFPDLFPGGTTEYHDGYRVTSKWLNRNLQEDISALPEGIQDWGLECGFTPIDLVIEHLHVTKFEAKAWLCEKLSIEDEVGVTFDVDEIVEPTIPAASFSRLDEARAELEHLIGNFIRLVTTPTSSKTEVLRRFVINNCEDVEWNLVHAIRSETGLGKTREIILAIANADLLAIYAVPNHYLSAEIEHRFLEIDESVKIFRGREQDDPKNPDVQMCLKLEAVKLAMMAHMPISQTCCSWSGKKCEFFDRCGYQRQKERPAKIIVIASDSLFYDQPSLGEPDILVIDESVWKKGLRGISGDKTGFFIPFATLQRQIKGVDYNLIDGRRHLASELQQQEDDGGLRRQYIENAQIQLDQNLSDIQFQFIKDTQDQNLHHMIVAEWKLIKKLVDRIKINPALPLQEVLRRHVRYKNDIEQLALSRNVITLLQELREMLRQPEIKTSGRILIEEREGLRGIRWRGVTDIVKRYRVPTLLLDATLPDINILQVMFPDVEIVGDISVDFPPSVHVRQYLGAPTSAGKLVHTDNKKKPERHLVEIRRHILRRWIENGRQPALVICQLKVERWLKDKLPENITVVHYKSIVGLDAFGSVRLLILIGHTLPKPYEIEATAATLSGSMPEIVESNAKDFSWYERIKRVIRLRDGTGRATYGDQHPDPFVESVRKQECEAEQEQAIGRGRGINRDDDSPLDVDLLFNECLPGAVDEVLLWDDQSELIETAMEGAMLTSAVDLVKIWPALWPNLAKAKRTAHAGVPALPGFVEVRYRLAGNGMKTRTGYFDLNIIPNPLKWLEERLGTLTLEE